jgi:FkbM family methyltransferase
VTQASGMGHGLASIYDAMRSCVRAFTRRVGYDVVRYHPRTPALEQRRRLMEHHGIATVIDIGANVGQYGKQLRKDLGFEGQIISFEPVPSAYERLASAAASDPKWAVHNMAVGSSDGMMDINVSENLVSSSFLEMGELHQEVAPDSRYCGTHRTRIARLDAIFEDLVEPLSPLGRMQLKIDTQGFEKQVIEGASQVLARMSLVQMELSLVPLYAQEEPFLPMCDRMAALGFGLVSLESGFTDPLTGRLLQVDAFFAPLHDVAADAITNECRTSRGSLGARE